jgi:hypothetical protein
MKKTVLFALLSASLLAGCTSEQAMLAATTFAAGVNAADQDALLRQRTAPAMIITPGQPTSFVYGNGVVITPGEPTSFIY